MTTLVGEGGLAAAVIARGAFDTAWIESTDGHPGTFEWWCDVAGVDPQAIRAVLANPEKRDRFVHRCRSGGGQGSNATEGQ
jgi:hypothetical protein